MGWTLVLMMPATILACFAAGRSDLIIAGCVGCYLGGWFGAYVLGPLAVKLGIID